MWERLCSEMSIDTGIHPTDVALCFMPKPFFARFIPELTPTHP
jgi:hypothetical protein